MSLPISSIAAATKAVEEAQRILVVPHANVDPDGIASALACYQLFQGLGKNATVICPDTLPESLGFLPSYKSLEQEIAGGQNFVVTINLDEGVEVDKLRYTVEDNRVNIIVVPKKGHIRPQQISLGDGARSYDLIVVVDTADLSLLGSLFTENIDLFSNIPILNIDHHVSNTGFGQYQMIDPTAASATEVLYSWFTQVPAYREHITADLATLLLTGIITDTRSFQNPNTTPRSLEVAAELLERGARQQEIIQHIYKTKPLSTLRIWGRALHGIQVDVQNRIVWSGVSGEDLQEMSASPKETHGILDELISTIPDADVHVLFTELGPEEGIKASMRSSAAIDASALAGILFGGGGHPRAAGFRIRKYENFQLAVVDAVRRLADGMKRQQEESSGSGQAVSVDPAPRSGAASSQRSVQNGGSRIGKKPEEHARQQPTSGIDIARSLAGGGKTDGGTDVIGELSS